MSIKDRLAQKTAGLTVPDAKSASKPGTAGASPLRTSPGQMLMVNALTKENNQRIAQLEEQLKGYDGAFPTRLIAPQQIRPSKWANRLEESFMTPAFAELKDEIAQAGGNVQPIKVRPVMGTPDQYEVVFGHRRHRACLEVGVNVLALVEDVGDADLFKAMERENRLRQNLAPWEQGQMYRSALREGLFGSIGELAREVGIDKGNLSKALALADLPEEIVAAFRSPLDLQFRWAKLLNDALRQDLEGVLTRARGIAAEKNVKRPAKEVLEALTGMTPPKVAEQAITVGGKTVGKMVSGQKGITVEFAHDALTAEQLKKLPGMLEKFLAG